MIEAGKTCMMSPPVTRNVPVNPRFVNMHSIMMGRKKDPRQGPDRENPEAVARYFKKYWGTITWERVLPSATPKPKT